MARPFSVTRQTGFGTIAIFCFAALYLPIFVLVAFAFNAGENMSDWQGFSLRWFDKAFHNQQVIDASFNSLKIAGFAAVGSTLVATMAAIATTRTTPFKGLGFIYGMINLCLIVPEIVTAVALLVFFAQIRIFTGYTGFGYLFAAHTAFCIPFAYLPIRARLESMDLTLERAAADLYATPWKTFRYISLPLLRPGILAGFMLAFVISLDDVIITNLVKSGGQDTLPTYMLGQIRRAVTPETNAISAVFLLLSVVIVTVFYFLNKKRN